jgi:uncharacterized repeat protein (TIGR02543 family)
MKMIKIKLKALLFLILPISFSYGDFPQYGSNPYTITLQEPVAGYTFFTVDVNGDGLLDYTFRSETKLYVYDHYGTHLWNQSINYPVFHYNHDGTKHGAADVDGDGQVEIAALNDQNQVIIYNAATGALENTYSFTVSSTQISAYIAIANLRGVGDRDAIIQTVDKDHMEGSFQYYINRTLIAVNLETGQEIWRLEQDDNPNTPVLKWDGGIYEGYMGQAHGPFFCADVDLDGYDEVIGGNLVEEDGSTNNLGYFESWRRWVQINQTAVDHLDAICVGDFDPDNPGLEWVMSHEDHLPSQLWNDYWHTVLFCKDDVIWHAETELFNNNSEREPQNLAVGDFDTSLVYCEIWNRSRFEGLHTHSEGTGQHSWTYDIEGTQLTHYGTENTLPAGFSSSERNGNADGLEIIWTIDWDGGSREYIAAQARHVNDNAGIFDAMTGEAIWTTIGILPEIESYFIYVADVAGDSREELMIYEEKSGVYTVKIFWNSAPNPSAKPSKWNDPLYKRLKQNWNYYSPGSYISHETIQITLDTSPSGLSVTVDGQTVTTPHTFSWKENTQHTITVNPIQSGPPGTRYVFSEWSDGGNQTHELIVPGKDKTITAVFTSQYYLNVNSPWGSPQGQGWYDENTTANFSIGSPQEVQQSRYTFSYWSGDYSGSNPSGSITMNAPKTVIANWDAEHYLSIFSSYGNPQGSGWYAENTSAPISVTTPVYNGDTRYLFLQWTGDYSGTSPTASVLVDTSKMITAEWRTQYYVATSEDPDNGGNMVPSPPGAWYNDGNQTTVSATALSGYQFVWWSGNLTGSENPTTLLVNSPKSVTANFGREVQITINTQPSGLQFSIDGDTYTAPHTFQWVEKTSHSIGAVSPQNAGTGRQYVFTSWSDGGSQTHNYTVPGYYETLTVTYHIQYQLTIDSDHGNPQGTGWYNDNTTANFSISSPDVQGHSRYLFSHWTGDYTGTETTGSITMNGPKTILAHWTTQHELNVNSLYGDPQGSGWYDENSTANFSVTSPYTQGSIRFIFSNWTGDASGTNPSSSIVMTSPKSVTANWNTQYYLTTAESPDAGGNMTPSPPGNWFDSGENVPLSASAVNGYQFTGWSGSITGTTNPTSINMDQPKSVTAHFGRNVQITIQTNPNGLTFTVDDIQYTAPQTFSWIEGNSYTIGTSSPQSGGTGTQYLFNNWSQGGNQNQSYEVPGSNETITANFNTQYYLTVLSSYGNPQGEGWYNANTTANFSVTSPITVGTTRYNFDQWNGDYTGFSPSGSVTMDAPKTVTAQWITQHYLTVVNGGYGTVTGEGWYNEGETAPFSISPTEISGGTDIRYQFQGWAGSGPGAYSGSQDSFSVVMNNPITETAQWHQQFYLSTNVNPSWGGSMTPGSPGAWYQAGTPAPVTAYPNSGYAFSEWSGDLSGNMNPTEIIMDTPKEITAHFIIVGLIRITTNPEGLTITVDDTVYTSPKDFQWLSGTIHTLSAPSLQIGSTSTQYLYKNWSDGGARTHSITVNNINLYTAEYTTQYYLSTSVNPQNGGWITPSPPGTWYDKDTYAQVSADPNTGYTFSQWSGDLTGTESSTSLYMNSPKSIIANFGLTHVLDDSNPEITRYELKQNYPNPFNPGTKLQFQIPEMTHVLICVFNSKGQKIRILINEEMKKGSHEIYWNGLDDQGKEVSSGIYIFIMKAGNIINKRKTVRLR